SRAATATSRWPSSWAGPTIANSAMRDAPSIPIRRLILDSRWSLGGSCRNAPPHVVHVSDTGPYIANGTLIARFVMKDGVLLHDEPTVKPIVSQRCHDARNIDVTAAEARVHALGDGFGVAEFACLDTLGKCGVYILQMRMRYPARNLTGQLQRV